MKSNKLLIFIVLLIFLLIQPINKVKAQKIYTTDREYQAEIKVFVVNSQYQADLLVYKTDKEYKARSSENKGIWFFVKQPYQSDKKIYFTDKSYKADLKVYFTDKEYKAGWRNNSLKYLMY